MNWINLETTKLDCPQLMGASNEDLGIWLRLMRYCCGQENGGRIEAASDMDEMGWIILAKVRKEQMKENGRLWHWDGDTLVVWGYPEDKQGEVQMKRELAKKNGGKGGRPKNQRKTNEKPTSVSKRTNGKPTLVSEKTNEKPTEKAEGEGEGELEGNWNGMEVHARDGVEPDIYGKLAQQVAAVLREFPHMNEMDVANQLRVCPEEYRGKALEDMMADVANRIEPPASPFGLLKAFMRNAKRFADSSVSESSDADGPLKYL